MEEPALPGWFVYIPARHVLSEEQSIAGPGTSEVAIAPVRACEIGELAFRGILSTQHSQY
jgi:hypothetical protein